MTKAQKAAFVKLVRGLRPTYFAHGDCVGADSEAVLLVSSVSLFADPMVPCHVVCHPPVDESLRAFNKLSHEVRPPMTYLSRNRDIVYSTDALAATPLEMAPQTKGGTWYSISYARRLGKPVAVIYPDGRVSRDGDWSKFAIPDGSKEEPANEYVEVADPLPGGHPGRSEEPSP